MPRIGYDSVTPANMPTDGAIYAGYVDGHWPTLAEVKRRFPHKLYVSITVNGTHDALCADVETGDFSAQGGARWAQARVKKDGLAWLYCNASTWPSVQAEVHALGLTGHVYFWIAHYGAAPVIPGGAIGLQYLGDYHGYDKSVFAAHLPGVDLAPAPHPTPHPDTPGWFVRNLSYPAPAHNPGVTRRVTIAGHGTVPLQFGKDVMRVQKIIGTGVDGLYGPGTTAAMEEWQRRHGMNVNGHVTASIAVRLGP